MRIEQPFFEIFPTAFGTMGIVWWNAATGPRVRQAFLNNGRQTVEEIVRQKYPNARQLACPEIAGLVGQIQRVMAGKAEVFDLENVAMEVCRPFQRQGPDGGIRDTPGLGQHVWKDSQTHRGAGRQPGGRTGPGGEPLSDHYSLPSRGKGGWRDRRLSGGRRNEARIAGDGGRGIHGQGQGIDAADVLLNCRRPIRLITASTVFR